MLWNIFCSSRKSFKLVVLAVVFLSILLMIFAIVFSYAFAFVLSASSFPNMGLRLTQQLENTSTMATRQLGVSQNDIFSDQNPSDRQDNGTTLHANKK